MHKRFRTLFFWLISGFVWITGAQAIIIPYEELYKEISVDYDGVPLIDAIADIERRIQLPIVVDVSVLRAGGFDARQKVTLHLKNIDATTVIAEVIKQTKPMTRLCIVAHPDYLRGGPKKLLLTTAAGHSIKEMIYLPEHFDP